MYDGTLLACSDANNADVERLVCIAQDAAELGRSGVPSEVRILRSGLNRTTKGDFTLDNESAAMILREFDERGVDIVVDFEHQSLESYNNRPDGKAPAAGWIKALSYRQNDGLYGSPVDWTGDGHNALETKAYRYFSPVVHLRKRDGKLVSLHSVALTNKPATIGAEPLVSKDSDGVVSDEVRELLGFKDGDVDADTVAAKIRGLQADAGELSVLKERAIAAETDALILSGRQQGKLYDANDAFARKLIAKDRGLYDEWIKITPVAFPQGRTNPPPASTGNNANRGTLIASSRAQYRQQEGAGRAMGRRMVCSERAFVNTALRDAGQDRMADEEITRYAIVG